MSAEERVHEILIRNLSGGSFVFPLDKIRERYDEMIHLGYRFVCGWSKYEIWQRAIMYHMIPVDGLKEVTRPAGPEGGPQ